MSNISRREFIKFLLASTGGLSGCHPLAKLSSAMTMPPPSKTSSAPLPFTSQEYGGPNLSGWEVVLGDGIYAAPGEPPVSIADIETVHFPDHSKLRANIYGRRIMAHNITFKRIVDENALHYIHTAHYTFQLPYQPTTSNNNLNGETIEGHLSIWDGTHSNLEYLTAFQWVINPWATNYGTIQAWNNPGVWTAVGQLTPDTAWHQIEMVLDTATATTDLTIDGVPYASFFVTLPHPDWGDEIAARFAAEIISLYPGETGEGAFHHTNFKDWGWVWQPRHTYLPVILGAG